MKKAVVIFFIIIASTIGVLAQEKSACPEVGIIGPPSTVSPGETMTFSVGLDKVAKKLDLDFEWKIDKGKIIKGQGTRSITVSTEELLNKTITATVNIGGLPSSCVNKMQETGIVAASCVLPIMLDDFGKIKDDDVKARIDAVIFELKNRPHFNAVIISYGSVKFIHSRQTLITNHSVLRGLDITRLVFINGGKGDFRTKIWLLPEGTDLTFLSD